MKREIISNPESDSTSRGSRVIRLLGKVATELSDTGEATDKLSKWVGTAAKLMTTTAEFITIGEEVYKAFSSKNPK